MKKFWLTKFRCAGCGKWMDLQLENICNKCGEKLCSRCLISDVCSEGNGFHKKYKDEVTIL